jgi:hypothetical protein
MVPLEALREVSYNSIITFLYTERKLEPFIRGTATAAGVKRMKNKNPQAHHIF